MATFARSFSHTLRTSTSRATLPAVRQSLRQQSRRAYADAAQPKPSGGSSSNALLYLLGAGALGGAGYYVSQNFDLTGAAKDSKPFSPQFDDYQKVYDAIAKAIEEHDDYDDGSYGPVLLRLAWHASGTYDKETGTGGSNGATMRFAPDRDHGANAGLQAARDFLEPIKQQFPWITYSDLWTLAGVTAIQEMQGPTIAWRPGRADRDASFVTSDGRLPDASKEHGHLRDIFYRMGFNDQEIVALSGAHALGRCHTDRSGFDGPWTFSPTTLTNDYYKLLLEEKWGWKKWNGPKQFEDTKTKSLMMLPTDMALIKDKKFRAVVEKYAKDNDAFFRDFADVIVRLFELGVPFAASGVESERMKFKSSFAE